VPAFDPEKLYYRGTQRRELGGVRGAQSWTDAIAVALIWSAVPGDPWASSRERRDAHFIETSTVHAAHLVIHHPLVIRETDASVADVMEVLRYGKPDGITGDEVRKVFNYLHNRIYGKAKGGDFSYVITDEDGEELDPSDEPFSLTGTSSYILDLRDEVEYTDNDPEVAGRLHADAYVYFDSKTVQAVARRLGFDGFVYPDIFEGCEYAARDLFGKDVECDEIKGIADDRDVKGKTVFTHMTYRPLSEASVVPVWDAPSLALLPDVLGGIG
jgi:hypothetical protein